MESLSAQNDAIETEYRKVAARLAKYETVETEEACAQLTATLDQLRMKVQQLDTCEADARWKKGAAGELEALLVRAAQRDTKTGLWFEQHSLGLSEQIRAAKSSADCGAVEKQLRALNQRLVGAAVRPAADPAPGAPPVAEGCNPDDNWRRGAQLSLGELGKKAAQRGGAVEAWFLEGELSLSTAIATSPPRPSR